MSTRRAGSGRYRPSLSSLASSSRSRVTPYSSTAARVIFVDARRAVVPAHRDPRAPQHVTAADLVIQRVEPTSGIGLGRPVQRMLQGTDRIPRYRRSLRGGTSTDGTHRAPPHQRYASTKQRPFPPRRLCCPAAQPVLRPPPTPTRPAIHFPACTGYRTPRSGDMIRRPPGRGGPPQFPPPPSIRSAPHTPGSPSRLRFQALHRFHGLRPDFGGSALPVPARRRDL
jgi:hypothetical protein